MKLDKKQMPQVIVLGVLLLACIGYVTFQFTSHKPAPPAPAPAEQAQGQDQKADETAEQVEKLANLPAVSKRDPFSPVMVASLPGEPVPLSKGQYNSATVRERVMSKLNPNRPVPTIWKSSSTVPRMPGPMHVEPIPLTMVGGRTNGSVSSIPVTPGDPNFIVTGVIRGGKNVAIVRSGDERHIVREGQYIQGKYRVDSVTDDGVVLSESNRRISLKLGGEKNAKQ
jgi:hypothetical protein